jgi:hypothetical protein
MFSQVQALLREIAKKIREGSHATGAAQSRALSGQEISDICFGMKSLSSTCPETIMLIDSLLTHINRGEVMSVSHWCRAMFGLHFMSTDSLLVRSLVRALSDKVGGIGVLASQGVKHDPDLEEDSSSFPLHDGDASGNVPSNALVNSSNEGSREVSIIRLPTAVLVTPRDIGSVLYGMQNMSMAHPEVSIAVQYVTEAIKRCHAASMADNCGGDANIVMAGSDIACSMYALREMPSKLSAVRALVRELATLLNKSTTPTHSLASVQIALALRGLSNMNSYRTEVRELVAALAAKASLLHNEDGSVMWTPRGGAERLWSGELMSGAIYGLRNMNSNLKEVGDLLRAILPFMETDQRSTERRDQRRIEKNDQRKTHVMTQNMSMAQACVAMYGLKNMTNDPSSENGELVSAILSRVLERTCRARSRLLEVKADFAKGNYTPSKISEDYDVFKVSARNLADALYGMQSMKMTHLDTSTLFTKVMEAYAITKELEDHQIISSADTAWDIPQFSTALFGLIGLNFSGQIHARKLLKSLLSDITVSPLVCSMESRDAMSSSPPRVIELRALQKRRLYQVLMMFYAHSYVHDTLSHDLRRQVFSALLEVQSHIRLPPLTKPSSHIAIMYKDVMQDLMADPDRTRFLHADVDVSSNIEAFHGVYLHGFVCDIVLVGFYGKWCEDFVEPGYDVGSSTYSKKYESNGFGTNVKTESPVNDLVASDNSDTVRFYSPVPTQITREIALLPLQSETGSAPPRKYMNTSSQNLVDFINSKNSDRLVVVNIEIDGDHKDLVGAETWDAYRDECLKEMHNVIVKRVKLTEKHKTSATHRVLAELDSILETMNEVV